jgi:hypothetical protein
MRSNSPFRQDKCATGWAKMKKKFLLSSNLDPKAWEAEKKQFKCNESTGGKIVSANNKEYYSEDAQTKEAKERGISKGKTLPLADQKK